MIRDILKKCLEVLILLTLAIYRQKRAKLSPNTNIVMTYGYNIWILK